MDVRDIPRAYRTARYLHWSQLTSRAWRTAQRYFPGRRAIRFKTPPNLTQQPFDLPPEFAFTCPTGLRLVNMLCEGKLELLNQTHEFGPGNWDWRLGQVNQHRLWTVTLHYHQWLYALAREAVSGETGSQAAMQLWTAGLSHWLDHCDLDDPGTAPLAWNSYAIATRLAWSIRAWLLLADGPCTVDPELANRWRDSLYRQAIHLSRNIEWDLRANHLLRDAVGLAWAGRFFDTKRSRQWIDTATQIAIQQSNEQMLDDGGHFERSPYYHLEVMDDWLSLATLLPHDEARQRMRKTWSRSAEYAAWMRHPDGMTPQFNDGAATQTTPATPHSTDAENRTILSNRKGGKHFRNSGIAVWHGTPWTVFWDIGEVGADCQPGHAHADTLSIECSYLGQRLFVDPGCYSYDNDQRRRYDRATASHNTICIDNTDSSEVWHIFRVGRRARPCDVQIEFNDVGIFGSAAHDGYKNLPGSPQHRRELQCNSNNTIQIRDTVIGTHDHTVEGGWLLHPRWNVLAIENGWVFDDGHNRLQLTTSSEQTIQLSKAPATYHPNYGIEEQTTRVLWRYTGQLPVNILSELSPA